jgi:hypothetical protein
MAVALLGVLLAATLPPLDRLAPEGPGFAAQSEEVTVVVRLLNGAPKAMKLLLSDAQTDAPIQGEVEVERFGPVGQAARAKAVAGSFPGHYLVELGEASGGRQALVVKVTAAGRPPEILAVDGLSGASTASPLPAAPGNPSPDVTVMDLSLLALAVTWPRRGRRFGLAGLLLAFALLSGSDARAHGPGGDVAPEPPGSQLYLAQEIQFALGLRTASVELKTFSAGAPGLAARQYPAIPREAVVERDGKKLVMVRLAPERFVAREATLGWADGDWVAVERGVSPGERIVVDGAAFLRNGGAVPP